MKRLFLLLCYLFCQALNADTLIIEPDMGRAPVLQLIQSANRQISLIVYGLTDQTMLDALIKAHDAGKEVRVILEAHPFRVPHENDRAMHLLTAHHIPWQARQTSAFTHQKTLIVDRRDALVMTFNLTQTTFKNSRNFGIVVNDPQTVQAIQQSFQADWRHLPQASFVNEKLLLSPINSRAQLLTMIDRAKRTIVIYAQTIKDKAIIEALGEAADRGVLVKILTSNQLKAKYRRFLNKKHILLRYSRTYYIHAKALVIDEKTAIIGSINFTRQSLDRNRELAVISEDKALVQSLLQTFSQDFNAAASRS